MPPPILSAVIMKQPVHLPKRETGLIVGAMDGNNHFIPGDGSGLNAWFPGGTQEESQLPTTHELKEQAPQT